MPVIINGNGTVDTGTVLVGNSDITGLAAGSLPANVIGAGAVLQVVSTTKTNTFSTTSASLVDITGLSVTITPTSSSNKIMVLATVTGGSTDAVGIGTTFQLVRNSTNIATSTTTGGSTTGTFSFAQRSMGTQNMQTSGVNFIDSPATTSVTTYKLQCLTQAGTLFVNQDGGGSCTGISSITVMEIAA